MQPNGPTAVLDAMVSRTLDAGVPGAHLSVAVGDRVADSCAGYAQTLDHRGPARRPLTPDTAHDLGSVTKVAGTTSMLAALASAGDLSADDEVRRFLPEARSGSLAEATLRDLLTHRAGLWEWWPTYLMPGDPVAAALELPLRYPPRTGRHYSDLGFMILGRVVESATGQPLPEALDRLVLHPLSIDGLRYGSPPAARPVAASSRGDRIERRMVATGVPYPVTVRPDVVDDFAGWRSHVLVGEVNDGNAFHSFGGVAGHAGLFGTSAALHRLGAVLLASALGEGGWPAVPSFFAAGPDAGQLLGFRSWRSDRSGCAAEFVGHTGFPGIGFAVVPRHRGTVVLATNRLHVDTEPAVFGPLWEDAISAAHEYLHSNALES
jgi:CubicO group peptidase (beta-lactamase class C family)